jgi:hypothetical protein
MRTPIAILAALLVAGGSACRGKADAPQENPQTKLDLDQCNKDKAEKDRLIKAEEDENARLMREKGSGGGEIVVSLEGNLMTVKPAGPGEPAHPIDDKATAAASKEFVNVVEKSRGAIQKCYEQALKKNSGLQSRSVTLSVQASFAKSGAYSNAAFSPSLGDVFDICIRTVASKWTLSTTSPAMTFKAQVSLTPS